MFPIQRQAVFEKPFHKILSISLSRPTSLFQPCPSLQDANSPIISDVSRLQARFCQNGRELKKVYRLRYSIFTKEYGARIKSLRRFDKDRYDQYCEHLVVKDKTKDRIVGYSRVLPYAASRALGSFYSENEFDISSLEGLQPQAAEIGRTCIHPSFRNGTTIATLWSYLAQYLKDNNIRYLFGCASISLRDGGYNAQAVLNWLEKKNALDKSLNVSPRLPLALFQHPNHTRQESAWALPKLNKKTSTYSPPARQAHVIPPLLKAYVNMGVRVAPIPHWDVDFNVADLFILLDTKALNPRYIKRFMKVATSAAVDE
jgi:putative hemolysin